MLFFARRKVNHAIGATVGLASEGIKKKKANKADKEQHQQQDVHPEQDSDEESDYDEKDEVLYDHEEQWDLDEAIDRLLAEAQPPAATNPSGSNESIDADYVQLIESLAQQYPVHPLYEEQRPFLQYPVVVPQRRPRTRARGFVRAYAPDLNAFGIDQDMFLGFIDRANELCRGCPALGLLNLAGLAAIVIPAITPVAGIAMSVALQIVINTTIAMDGRRKSNNFFDAANRDIFMPRGLFCLVMTWNPEIDDPCVVVDMNQNINTAMTRGGGGSFGKLKHKFQKADAESHFIPEVAPLIFPTLDQMDMDPETKEKNDTWKQKTRRKFEFVSEYRDKRTEAKFINEDPDSALVQRPEPEFTSRYADPNHPANEGSALALLTGGHLTEKQLFRYTPTGFAYRKAKEAYAKHEEKKRDFQGEFQSTDSPYPEAESSPMNNGGNGDPKTEKAGGASKNLQKMKNKLRKKVVYLMIVNMPNEEDLHRARETLELG